MLCYYYPPIASVGAIRSVEFAAALRDLGWDITVLTVEQTKDRWAPLGAESPSGIKIVRTPEWDLFGLSNFMHGVFSKAAGIFGHELKMNYVREFFCIPDCQIAWRKLHAACTLAQKADAVYVSCSPFSSAVSACKLKQWLDLPIIIDFRDAWSLNPHLKRSPRHQKRVESLEHSVIEDCSKLILNTEGAKRQYSAKYPGYKDKFIVIPNGFDKIIPAHSEAKDKLFRIMHFGAFYGERSPRTLLDVLAEMDRNDIEFVQAGGAVPEHDKYHNKVRIKVFDNLPRDQALKLMSSASLLFLNWGWVDDYTAIAAKTYEYLATALPILAELPPGDNVELVKKYCPRPYCVMPGDKDGIKKALLAELACRHDAPAAINEEFRQKYDRRALALQLSKVLEHEILLSREIG